MGKLPIFLDMSGKKAIVVGGGNAAFIKIRNMLKFNVEITVVSEKFSKEIESLFCVKLVKKSFEASDLKGFYIAVAAADYKTNLLVYNAALDYSILCSVSGKEFKGDFIFPAVSTGKGFTVTASTDGAYPMLARKICDNISFDLSEKIEFLKCKRTFILENFSKDKQHIILKQLIQDNVILSDSYKEKIEEIIKRYKNEQYD